MLRLLGASVTIMTALAAPAAAQSDRSAAQKLQDILKSPPIIFYLAKGEPDSCGQGCSEWIAAEGRIDWGATQRLRGLLTRLGKRKLPIFFHSPGGVTDEGMALGRLLREKEMTAAVSRTIPAACAGRSEEACRTLQRSGQTLVAELHSLSGCNSACVFALVGAKVRQVPPGAQVGVHAPRWVRTYTDGRIETVTAKDLSQQKIKSLEAELRRYVVGMGISGQLFDEASKISHDEVRYLSRDEIAGFGIDTHEFREARWITTESQSSKFSVLKFFVEDKGEGRRELRTSVIQLQCAGPRHANINYLRGVGSDETATKQAIAFKIDDDRSAALSGSGRVFKIETLESNASFNLWSTSQAFEFADAAAARDSIYIVETDTMARSRVIKLSTAGMSHAITELRRRCESAQPAPSTARASDWLAAARAPLSAARASDWSAAARAPLPTSRAPEWPAAAPLPPSTPKAPDWSACRGTQATTSGCSDLIDRSDLSPRDRAVAYSARANIYYSKGDYDGAIRDYDEAIRLSPDTAIVRYSRSAAYHQKGDYAAVIRDASEAIRIDATLASAYPMRAFAYIKMGDYDRAIRDYDEAIRLGTNTAVVYANRGAVHFHKRDYDAALRDYDLALGLDPKNARGYNRRGVIYCRKGEYDRAIEDFDAAIRLDPGMGLAYINRGGAYREKGDLARGMTEIEIGIGLVPQDESGYYQRGLLYERMGDTTRALADLRRSVELKSTQDARAALARVEAANKAD